MLMRVEAPNRLNTVDITLGVAKIAVWLQYYSVREESNV